MMFPFQNEWNKDTHTVTMGTRRYVSFSFQIVCLDTNNIIFLYKSENFKILDMFPYKSSTKTFRKPLSITVKNLVMILWMVGICMHDKKKRDLLL